MLSQLARMVLSRLVGFVALLCLAGACDTAPPTAERRPQTRPTASRPLTTERTPTSAPATTQPTPTTSRGHPRVEEEPEIPDYVTIVARFNAQQRAGVEVHAEAGNRLVIDTHNVRRLHIDRDRVPLDRRRSISLQLDGQGLEWLASSKVVEFERAMNGEWVPAKPDQRGKP